MKNKTTNKALSMAAAILLLFCIVALPVLADYPAHEDFIADESGVLSESTIRTIKKTNNSLEDDAKATIAVCTVDTTGTEKISVYARKLFTEWKMGEGVLLLIAVDDNNYYFVQSVGVSKILTNDVLKEVRDEYFEAEFAEENIDNAVLQTVAELSDLLLEGAAVSDDDDDKAESDDDKNTEKEGGSVGKFIVGFLKVILYIVLTVVVAFVVLFIVAMFNDDAAAFMQKYIFRRGQRSSNNSYYDERLYGNNRPSNDQRRAPNQQARRPQNQNVPRRDYNDQYRRQPNTYQHYNADGTPRTTRQAPVNNPDDTQFYNIPRGQNRQ